MSEPLILTFDCGTQSVRGLLFDKKGTLVGKSQISFEPYIAERAGWAERHPDFYWEKLCQASRMLKEQKGDRWGDIVAVTVTTMRDTAVLLDEQMNVVRPSILWLDQRMAECREPFPLFHRFCFHLAGMTDAATEQRKCTKANWIQENQPELWEKTRHYVLLSCYMTYKLTGRLVDSIANQVGHIPFAYKKKRWMKKSNLKYRVFNIDREKLPPLVEPGEVIGELTEEAARQTGLPKTLRLIATGSDKGCETIGTGCIDESMGSLSFGTTSTIQLTTEKYVEPTRFLPAYPAVLSGKYNPEIEIYRGYWMISWYKREFAAREQTEAERAGIPVEALLNSKLSQIPPGSEGLVLQPYWGAGLKNPEAKGAIIGFSDVHTRAHMYRAIIEGVNYALRDGLETVSRRAGIEVSVLTVSGGGSESDEICQITADMFGKKILRAQTFETSGLGSSMVGFVGAGEFASIEEAVKSMVHHTSVFEPDMERYREYTELFQNVYQQMYPRLKPLYKNIRKIYR